MPKVYDAYELTKDAVAILLTKYSLIDIDDAFAILAAIGAKEYIDNQADYDIKEDRGEILSKN